MDTLVLVCLATIALEQARKRSIRRTLELSFLNHHVHNAMTQMIMASEMSDAGTLQIGFWPPPLKSWT